MPLKFRKAPEAYHIRWIKFFLIMTKLLKAAECQGILDQLDSQVTPNDGVLLLFAAKEAILPRISLQILYVLSDIGSTFKKMSKRLILLVREWSTCSLISRVLIVLLLNNYNWRHYSMDSSIEHILIMNH